MTRRGGRDASVRRRRIEDERQLEMAQLDAQCTHSNLVKLVMIQKGNQPG